MAFFDGATREETEERVVATNDREGTKRQAIGLNAEQDLGDGVLGGNHGGIADHPVNVVLHATDLGDLLFLLHIIVQETKSAVQGHRDGHAMLRDRIHIRGQDGQRKREGIGQGGV